MNLAHYGYLTLYPGHGVLFVRKRNVGGYWTGRGCSPHDPTLRVSLSLVRGEGGSKAHEGDSWEVARLSRQDLERPRARRRRCRGDRKSKAKRKGEIVSDYFLVVLNHSQVQKKGEHPRRKVVQTGFSPSTCCSPPGSPARQSRVRKVEGG